MNGQEALLKEKASLFSPCAEIDSDFRGLFSSLLPTMNMENQVEFVIPQEARVIR